MLRRAIATPATSTWRLLTTTPMGTGKFSTNTRPVDPRAATAATTGYPQNLIEKIVQRFAVDHDLDDVDAEDVVGDSTVRKGRPVRQGDFVTVHPQHVMTHDNTAAVMKKFKAIQAERFYDPRQPVFTLDHDIQNRSDANLAKYREIEAFAKKHNVDFFPAGSGIGHQLMIEQGYAFPYTLVVASDSHSNMYGGIGALGTPVVRTDAAALWATGRTWWQIPPVVKVELTGRLLPGISGKDVIVALCGLFNADQVLNTAIEFHGDGVRHLSVDDRLTIANMTTEWGALAGVFPVDDITLTWYHSRAAKLEAQRACAGKHEFTYAASVPSLQHLGKDMPHPRVNVARLKDLEANLLHADKGARYAKHLTLDLSTIRDPQVSGPNSVKQHQPLSTLTAKHIPVNKAYLLSCTNSRESDIRAAADVFRAAKKINADSGEDTVKVAPGVEFYVAAASAAVQASAEDSGDWQVLVDAGAKVLPPGCGPCIGLGVGLLQDGEVGISSTNRNFKGRMGSRQASAYLSSPAVVAASAIRGEICGPLDLERVDQDGTTAAADSKSPRFTMTEMVPAVNDGAAPVADMLPGFPAHVEGELVFCPVDNLNTDGIYPGKYTYREDLSPEEMARVAMENYDPAFSKQVQKNDILVAGMNFGSGSSREQAATSLKYAGVQLILAASFSETFKRNSLNNGLVCLEAPELVRDLHKWASASGAEKRPTYRPAVRVSVDYASGLVNVAQGGRAGSTLRKQYAIPTLGRVAQELIMEGGLEPWVKARMQ